MTTHLNGRFVIGRAKRRPSCGSTREVGSRHVVPIVGTFIARCRARDGQALQLHSASSNWVSRRQSDFFVRNRIVRKLGRGGTAGLVMLLVAPMVGFVLLAGSVAGFSAFADELRQFGEPRHAPALGAEPALVTDVGQQTGAEVGPPRVSTLRG